MIKTMEFEGWNDHHVFPSPCEQVFYLKVLGERDWSFVVKYDPRQRIVKYTIEEEDDAELEQEYQSTDKEYEVDEPSIGDNVVLNDDVNEDMIENELDDDDDIVNPFNTILNQMMIHMLSWMKKKI